MEFEILEKYLADARRYFGLEQDSSDSESLQGKDMIYRPLTRPSLVTVGVFNPEMADSLCLSPKLRAGKRIGSSN